MISADNTSRFIFRSDFRAALNVRKNGRCESFQGQTEGESEEKDEIFKRLPMQWLDSDEYEKRLVHELYVSVYMCMHLQTDINEGNGKKKKKWMSRSGLFWKRTEDYCQGSKCLIMTGRGNQSPIV